MSSFIILDKLFVGKKPPEEIIENAKFKRPVEPGDTLIFELELLSPIRRGISHMIARAYVDGELTTEAEMKAKIVKK